MINYVLKKKYQVGIKNIRRSAALNDNSIFIEASFFLFSILLPFECCSIYLYMQALADIVHTHLKAGKRSGRQLSLRCPLCVNPVCGKMRDYFK